jgi:hypothetical protein
VNLRVAASKHARMVAAISVIVVAECAARLDS